MNFLKECCKTTSKNKEFGLCDDPSPSIEKAYITEINPQTWIATVHNSNEISVCFYAIDNCVEIIRSNGEKEERCDGVLVHDKNLKFTELKDRASSGWLVKGLSQLTTTVKIFKSNYDLTKFDNVQAYICNKQRPLAITNSITEMQKFKDDTGLFLIVDRNIHI